MIGVLTPFEWEALRVSVVVGVWAVVLVAPLAIGAAWLLARRDFPGKSLLDAILHLPLVLPPVVVGYILLVVLGRDGPVGGPLYHATGLELAFTWRAAAIASAVIAFPLMVRAVRISIEAVPRELEEAAFTLGASPSRVFRTVTLPLALPGVIAGAFLAFARSLSEFGATITFAANIEGQTQTLPLALYTLSQTPGGEYAAARLCLIAIGVSFTTLLASEWLARRMHRTKVLR